MPSKPLDALWPMLCALLCAALLLAGALKSPALASYAEQRFHLTWSVPFEPLAAQLEGLSQSARLRTTQALQTADRAVVFGLQELMQGEISAQQAKQAQTLQAYQALQTSHQALLLDGKTSSKAKGKELKKTDKSLRPATELASNPLEIALPTVFRADYAARKLPLTSADRVLFIGDSLMQGVAPHAAQALSKALPGIFTLDLSRQSTGLAYAGFFDWPSTAKRAIVQHRINTMVVFIGANDFYDMPIQGKKFTTGTPQWEEGYFSVVQTMIAHAHVSGVRVVWMEMPPMNKALLGARVPALNAVYAKSAALHKALWVPTADAMSAPNGEYSKFLPNPQGSLVQMRLDDGVHFTVAGQKRLSARLLAQFSWSSEAKP